MLNSTWLLFNLFLGSLSLHLTQIFEPNATYPYTYSLLLLPPLLTLLYSFSGFKPLSKRLLISFLLPLALTLVLFRSELMAWGVFHPSHWDLLRLLSYALPFLGISLLALALFLYLERTQSVLLLLILASLLEMLIFSYVKRTWSLTIPFSFASGVLLQFVLRQKKHYRVQVQTPVPDRLHWPHGTGVRLAWIVFLIAFTLTLGLNLPVLAPVWFQNTITLNGVLGKPGKGVVPLDRETLFAWKTNNLGGPWQGDSTPLFFVQGPEPTYWRSETLDYFDSRGWWSRSGSPSLTSASVPLHLYSTEETQTYQIRLLQPLAQGTGLLAPGQLAELSKMSLTGVNFSYHSFANTLWANSLLPAQTEYSVQASLPKVSASDLRLSRPLNAVELTNGTVWSPWKMQNPMPLIQLTQRITKDIHNPYDQLQALSNYLKDNMTYTLNSPSPANGDFVSDFLFNTHQGYCIHFASSLVLMARVQGYASRLAMGFTFGSPLDTIRNPFPGKDPATVRLLTKNDAHSWAEIYFEGYGWIPFEATPGFSNPQEPFEHKELAAPDPSEQNPTQVPANNTENPNNRDPDTSAKERHSLPSYLLPILIALGLVPLSLISVFSIRRFRRRRRWLAMNGQERLGSIYQELLAEAGKCDLAQLPGTTPSEFLRRLPLGTPDWNRVWSKAILLVEKGLYAPGTGEAEAEALLNLRPKLLRLLRAHKRGLHQGQKP